MSRALLAALCLAGACLPGCGAQQSPPALPAASTTPSIAPRPSPLAALRSTLDQIFDDPLLSRALTAVRVDSLATGTTLYARNANKLVMPASNMKLVTIPVAAARLGWDYRYRTRLEAVGGIEAGTLHGDLVVTGSGDPSIGSPDAGQAEQFLEWADALIRAGIRRVDGRIIGDDNAFDDDGLGAGWAWDYLAAGYAAPAGALSYNENVAVVRATAAAAAGQRAAVTLGPPGHLLELDNDLQTAASGTAASIELLRLPGSNRLTVRGSLPAGSPVAVRTAAVDNPTKFFVEALRLALSSRGLFVSGGAWDIDEVTAIPATGRRVIAERESEPLSALAGYALKVSQNFYGETFFKTLSRSNDRPGTAEGGRRAVRETLTAWGVPADTVVMYDGSGLSRYNYVTADAIVAILTHAWKDETLRGPFVAALPVGGRDGTLETRMRGTPLDRNVQAKTGTINNARALSGYLETAAGEKLAFSMIVNNYTAPNAQIDAIAERALLELTR